MNINYVILNGYSLFNFYRSFGDRIALVVFILSLSLMSVILFIRTISYLIKTKKLHGSYTYPIIYLIMSILLILIFLRYSRYYFSKNRFELRNFLLFHISAWDVFFYVLVLSMFIFINYTFNNAEEFIKKNTHWAFRLSCFIFIIKFIFLFFFWAYVARECSNNLINWNMVYDKNAKQFFIPKWNISKDGIFSQRVIYRINGREFILKFSYCYNIFSAETSFINGGFSRFINLFELTNSYNLVLNEENMTKELTNLFNENWNNGSVLNMSDWNTQVTVMNNYEILFLIKDIKEKFGILSKIFNKEYNEKIAKMPGIDLNSGAYPHNYIHGGKNHKDQSVFTYEIIESGKYRFKEKAFYQWGFNNFNSLEEYMDFLIERLEKNSFTVRDFEIFRVCMNNLLQDTNLYLSVATEEEKSLIAPDSIDAGLDSLKKLVWEIGKVTLTYRTDNVKIV